MKEIPLTQGKYALVDDEDYDYLMQWKWWFHSCGYACRTGGVIEGRRKIYMHRVVANPTEDQQVDHSNGNRLDNQRSNLRLCTSSQNKMNRKPNIRSKTGVKGVTITPSGRFKAQIEFGGKNKNLGHFNTVEEAGAAYAEAAKQMFGEFSRS